MSQMPTYCKCSDGRWYEGPWRGYNDKGEQIWFLVLDDNDDPELVVKVDNRFGRKATWAAWKDVFPVLDWFEPRKHVMTSGRIFGGGNFHDAVAVFGILTKLPPPPAHEKGWDECPSGQYFFYDLSRKR